MKKIFLLPLSVLCLLSFSLTQDDPTETIVDKYYEYQLSNPVEKIHIQTDRSIYRSGDTLWISTYLLNADLKQTNLSKVVYVDLKDVAGEVVESLKIYSDSVSGSAAINLPDSLPSGVYTLVGYTGWMKNFDPEFAFKKYIHVINTSATELMADFQNFKNKDQLEFRIRVMGDEKPLQNSVVKYSLRENGKQKVKNEFSTDSEGRAFIRIPAGSMDIKNLTMEVETSIDNQIYKTSSLLDIKENPVSVKFFPESGDLLAGCKSKVGFKVTGPSGLGIEALGILYNGNNQEMYSFKTTHLGLGYFSLVPEPGKSYSVKIITTQNDTILAELPKIKQEGIVMSVIETPDKLNLKAIVFNSLSSVTGQQLIVVGHANQKISFMAKIPNQKGMVSVLIPKSGLPSGITQLTILTEIGLPLCERLVFVENGKKLNTDITAAKPRYGKREKVEIEISTTDSVNIPASANITVAAVQGIFSPRLKDEENIFTNLFLTSDLKGYVESPGSYLNPDGSFRKDLVDLLLLTHGWRRFKWSEVMNYDNKMKSYSFEKTDYITGVLKNEYGKPVKNGKISLVSSAVDMLVQNSDENGNFYFVNMGFVGDKQLYLQGQTKGDNKNVLIEINKPETLSSPFYAKNVQSSLINSKFSDYMEKLRKQEEIDLAFRLQKDVIQLEEVEVKGQKNKVGGSSPTPRIYGKASVSVSGDKLPITSGNLLNALNGLVAGVQVTPNGIGPPSIKIRGTSSINSGTEPLFLLDGMQVSADAFNGIMVTDVESIDVLKDPAETAIFGVQGANGVIAVYTKRGSGLLPSASKGFLQLTYKGFYPYREFYVPDYTTKSESAEPDYRTTIFWMADTKTDKNGKAKFTFYTSDDQAPIEITVESADGIGRIGRKVFRIE
jgi:TonB-dependent SusC/RagA subfamily outer membrane receptor